MSELIGISNNDFKDNKNLKLSTNAATNQFAKPIPDDCYENHNHCLMCDCFRWVKDTNNNPVMCSCSSNKLNDYQKKYVTWTGATVFEEKFSNYVHNHPEEQKNLKTVKKWCENIGKPDKPTHLFLFGNVGTGKSHLAKSCINFFVNDNRTGRYILYPEFNQLIKNIDENISNHIQNLMKIPILIFDEMYMGYDRSGYASGTFNDILHTRWERKRPTLVTGNIKPDQLSDPIRSRFMDDQISIRINSWGLKDKRLQKKAF